MAVLFCEFSGVKWGTRLHVAVVILFWGTLHYSLPPPPPTAIPWKPP
jgi:hypothetical protein